MSLRLDEFFFPIISFFQGDATTGNILVVLFDPIDVSHAHFLHTQ